MKLVQMSDYMIYFDDVRVDPYVINWNTWLGLFASDATASVTMYRTESMDEWKAYLTQVRVFGKNVFTGKFSMMFEGEISDRQWSDKRSDSGKVTFTIKGFYHWLDIPIPLKISTEESLNKLQRFIYEAQNINVSELTDVVTARDEILMKDKTIEEVIHYLFEQMNKGYYDLASEDSSFGWAKMKDRFKVMVDVMKEFREAGFMDLFTFVKGTQIETFYVYLNEVLSQLMFEFYQDRDGALRVKNPSWAEDILKNHILDESVVSDITGMDNWAAEPTRVLVIGGTSELLRKASEGASEAASEAMKAMSNVPVGLYIGSVEDGEYFSTTMEVYGRKYGVDADDLSGILDGAISTETWFDDITGLYVVTSGHRTVNSSRPKHLGVDYGMKYQKLRSVGTSGQVVAVLPNNNTGGNAIQIVQNISGTVYEFIYRHLDKVLVKVGDVIQPGQEIGTTGNTDGGTSVSTGAHLHFEIWKGRYKVGTDLNPVPFMIEMKKIAQEALDSGGATGTGSANTKAFVKTMTPYAIKASAALNIPVALILAQWGLESTWGKSDLAKRANNFAGIKHYDGAPGKSLAYAKYNTLDQWTQGYILIMNHKRYAAVRAAEGWKASAIALGNSPWAEDPEYGQKLINAVNFNGLAGITQKSGDAKADSKETTKTSTTSGKTEKKTTTSNPFSTVDPMGLLNPKQLYNGAYKTIGSGLAIGTNATTKKTEYKSVKYKAFSTLKFDIPLSAKDFQEQIMKSPNGIDYNLLCSIIANTSGWKEKYSTTSHVGIMPIAKKYANAVLANKDIKNGYNSIEYGTAFFAECMERFKNKVTFALAAYWEGDMSIVEEWSSLAGGLNYVKALEVASAKKITLQTTTISFVDKVIEEYVFAMGGEYIEGDPHKAMYGMVGEGGINLDPGVTTPPATDTEIPDYESPYKPILTQEEKEYKINLKMVEQQLIRNDSPVLENPGALGAQELVYRYAKYIMQVHRAQTHTLSVSLTMCMPLLRPGFNAWLEPSRTDVVFYVTGVGHQGSFGQGCFSSVRGSFVRLPGEFNKIDESIFVGEKRVSVADFGSTVSVDGMEKVRTELKELNNDKNEIVGNALEVQVLKNLYSSPYNTNEEFVTQWNKEYSAEEVAAKIAEVYSTAPAIIVTRKNNIKRIMDESEAIFISLLFKQKF